MPRWALGLWQSRERYRTAQEMTDTLAEFRKRGIPLDTIVMDWQYWRPDQWGSHQFDPERFPDPAGWIKEIHERWNAKLMISVWPKFYTTTDNFKAMQAKGFLYPETLKRPTTDWLGHVHTFYDAFNPEARKLFWQQMNEALFSKGVDAWWMDATEPELVGEGTPGALKAAMNPTALGSGARMANAYVLREQPGGLRGPARGGPEEARLHPHALGLRGQPALRRGHLVGRRLVRLGQPAQADPGRAQHRALRHSLVDDRHRRLRVPRKWSRQDPRPEDVEEWRELFTRWFQYATFCPLLRVHGQFPYREMWNFGGRGAQGLPDAARLRQAALPDAAVHLLARRGGDAARRDAHAAAGDGLPRGPGGRRHRRPVPARALAAREPGDVARRDAPRGLPAARPVARRARAGDGWYDFWTGAFKEAGLRFEAPAPYESLPVFVRAGSILPMGPELQYTAEKPADPLTLWVYTGRDGALRALRGRRRELRLRAGPVRDDPARWDEAKGTLTIGARTGSFPGMLAKRQLRVVFVSKDAARAALGDARGRPARSSTTARRS